MQWFYWGFFRKKSKQGFFDLPKPDKTDAKQFEGIDLLKEMCYIKNVTIHN
mgnify:CR=1 FL=1